MQYIIHVKFQENPIKENMSLTVTCNLSLLQTIRMLEKNSDVLKYNISQVSDFNVTPIDYLEKHFNWRCHTEKFEGVDPITNTVLPIRKNATATKFWRYTDPITNEITDYHFSHPLTRLEAVKLLILAEPSFFVSVSLDNINEFILSTVEPWIENEKINVFPVEQWISAINL